MGKRVTLEDISKLVGVSTTTVAKALNGKPKVSEEMREAIIKAAVECGYKPNKTAQALARNDIVIGIIYPKEPTEFMNYLGDGLKQGITELMDFKVTGIFLPVNDFNSTQETRNALKHLYDKKVDGIVLSIGFGFKDYEDLLNDMEQSGIPVLYLLNDNQELPGIGYVKLNGLVTGRMAAEFLDLCIPENKSMVIITSNKEISIHRECINGFVEEANQKSRSVKGIYEAQDDKKIAYYVTEKAISQIPDLGGIYVTSFNSVAVCKCLEDYGRNREIIVVGQDLYPELADKLKTGTLKTTLFQDQFNQGRTAIKEIYNYITENEKHPINILTAPQLVLASNLGCYVNKY